MAKDLTLLSIMSLRRRVARRHRKVTLSSPSSTLPPAEPPLAAPPDPRFHSPICCCLLCEQSGTGEQAMRSVGGDYARFLAFVGSSQLPASSQSPASIFPATRRAFPHRSHCTGSPKRRR